MKRHGGVIRVSSVEGAGSTFACDIPFDVVPSESTGRGEEADDGLDATRTCSSSDMGGGPGGFAGERGGSQSQRRRGRAPGPASERGGGAGIISGGAGGLLPSSSNRATGGRGVGRKEGEEGEEEVSVATDGSITSDHPSSSPTTSTTGPLHLSAAAATAAALRRELELTRPGLGVGGTTAGTPLLPHLRSEQSILSGGVAGDLVAQGVAFPPLLGKEGGASTTQIGAGGNTERRASMSTAGSEVGEVEFGASSPSVASGGGVGATTRLGMVPLPDRTPAMDAAAAAAKGFLHRMAGRADRLSFLIVDDSVSVF